MDDLAEKLKLYVCLNWCIGQNYTILDLEDVQELDNSYLASMTWKHGVDKVECENMYINKSSFEKWLILQELHSEVLK